MYPLLVSGTIRRLLQRVSLPVIAMGAIASPVLADVPKVGKTAPDFELSTLDDSKVKLSTLLKKGPVVLVVLRGFPGYQCPICTRQFGELRGKAEQFASRKAEVLLVYPGPAEGLKQHADEFVKGKALPEHFQMALDPDFVFTKKYDLRWDAPGETTYPSTFVIDSKGKITFARVSHSHDGRAKTTDVLKALPK